MITNFSQRLSHLMKERKISGQRIADAIGKSQKTISRYAKGEVDPNNEVKNQIYKAIAEISGIEEDGMTQEELDLSDFSENFMEDWEWTEYELELGRQHAEEECEKVKYLCRYFHQLTLDAKKYYLSNIHFFHTIEKWEWSAMEIYHNLNQKQKIEFVKILEKFDIDYTAIEQNAKSIAKYMEMIEISKNRPFILMEKNRDKDSYTKEELAMEQEFEEILNDSMSDLPGEPFFLQYTSYDWYVLMRIHFFELYDTDIRLWTQELDEVYMGQKLDSLLGLMRTYECK